MVKYSYAKINLALNVLNKVKPSKLHNLEMINVLITLKDKITIKFFDNGLNEIKIICNKENIPTDENNLIYKVIRKFQERNRLNFSCVVKLNKKIPTEAGLGGGSSNAATTLNMLDEHFKTQMTTKDKTLFLESITSDGPFFVHDCIAKVKGNGNQISKLTCNFNKKVLLIKPKSGCNTSLIYNSLDYQTMPHPNMYKVEKALFDNDLIALSDSVDNSLKDAAIMENNEISDILNRLKACGFELVNMSGSGSTCFAISDRSLPYKNAKKIFNKKKLELFKIYNTK